jgi:hypothetical protein
MIAGATRGGGGPYIVRHLLTQGLAGIELGANEYVEITGGRGLLADDLDGMVRELTARGAHGRTDRPLIHVHADPPPGRDWTAAEWKRWWSLYEAEFDLADRPFVEVTHRKHGREHKHRLYLAVRADGSVVNLSHEYARREKLSRIAEHETGAAFVLGRHNRAVHQRLLEEGRDDVAAAMSAAGLLKASRPEALSPGARQQAERTGMDIVSVDAAVLAAWQVSDGGPALVAALRAAGLRLVMGTKEVLVADGAGRLHPNPLGKLLGRASKAAGLERIGAAEVRQRLKGIEVPSHHDHVIAGEWHVEESEQHRGRPGGSGGDGEAGEAEGGGREWDDPTDLCSDGRGSELGRLAPAPRPAGVENAAGDRLAHGDQRIPGPLRAKALRDRSDAGRLGRALENHTGDIKDLTAKLRRGPPPALPVSVRGVRLVSQDTSEGRRGRRAVWIAVQLRNAYDTGWLPPSVADRIVKVQIDADARAVILTLITGTLLVDRLDRIEIVGRADDIAIAEITEAVHRRGWDTVTVEGDLNFRVSAAKSLYALEPPVNVLQSPLSEFELAEIDDARPSHPTSSPPAFTPPGSDRRAGPGGSWQPGSGEMTNGMER